MRVQQRQREQRWSDAPSYEGAFLVSGFHIITHSFDGLEHDRAKFACAYAYPGSALAPGQVPHGMPCAIIYEHC